MEPDNQDLLDELAKDLPGNYRQLVEQYWKPLRIFVLRRMIPAQDAEDMLQEIFSRAFFDLQRSSVQKIQTLKLRGWLYTIAWNACTNHLRSRQPILLSLEGEDDAVIELEDPHSEQPEDLFELKEKREELEALIETLPSRYRNVISLYFFEGFSQQEIAEMLEVRVGTVKVSVYRGLKLLHKALVAQQTR
jgi:RNA polymerase sigma-70 factor (ECF subfamily)